jgi:2-amino-4-hydroxy-6-hydroxymethyldihydropteridine diphosphokinase
MSLAFIGMGSNEGNSLQNLQFAWRKLAETGCGTLLTLSSPYKSEPVGVKTENWFVNAVGAIETRLSAERLLEKMLAIEKEMGRDRSQGVDRSIDLDLLYYDDLIMTSANLVLPHPEIQSRLFVLLPLAELAPDHVHPVLKQTTDMMRKRLANDKVVEKIRWLTP